MKKTVLAILVFCLANLTWAQSPMKGNPAVRQRPFASEVVDGQDSVIQKIRQAVSERGGDRLTAEEEKVLSVARLNFVTDNHDFYEVVNEDHNYRWLVNSDGEIIASADKLLYYDRVIVAEHHAGDLKWFEVVNYKGERFYDDSNHQNNSEYCYDDVRYITGSKGPYLVLRPYQGSRYMLVTPDFRRVGTWFETVSDAQAEWEREEGR